MQIYTYVSVLVQDAITRYHKLGGLNNRNLSLTPLGVDKVAELCDKEK